MWRSTSERRALQLDSFSRARGVHARKRPRRTAHRLGRWHRAGSWERQLALKHIMIMHAASSGAVSPRPRTVNSADAGRQAHRKDHAAPHRRTMLSQSRKKASYSAAPVVPVAVGMGRAEQAGPAASRTATTAIVRAIRCAFMVLDFGVKSLWEIDAAK